MLRERKLRPYLVTGWFWYVVGLAPVIGFLQVGGQAMADRYTYVPLIGLAVILAWGVARIELSLSVLTEHIANNAQDVGYSVLPAAERSPHMIGIRHPKGIPAALPQALRDANIYVSFRGDSIRIAPHLYNDLGDVDRLFKMLRAQA